ncbi:Por secretion system C-terminal sorting domain-containing protein [Candidatus Kryptobacter tengchongensis]|nr:Por secretion system C-terminal sorting domain-containing protein [Candidatus Kryptobacter tengchongensis]
MSEVKSLKLKVENRGGDTLIITGVSIADTSFRFLGNLPLVLNPGDTGFLNFSFKPSSSRFYVDTALIYSNSQPDSVFKLVLMGRGVKPPCLSSSVDSIDFGYVFAGDSVIKFLKLYNLGEIDTIRIVKLEISEPFSVVSSSNVINPGDSLNVILRFKPLSGRVYDGLLKVISTAWNDTLEIKVHGKGMPVVLNTNRRVQSGVVKFICRFNAVDSVKLKSFFYSVDGGSSWRLSSSVSSFAGIGVGVDTIYWDSKVDLSNFESANVAVRMDFSISSFDFSVRIDSVGVDNLAPRFRGVKSYKNLPFGKIILYWDKAVDINQVRYKVFVSDSLVFSGVEVDSAFVSGLRTSANYNFIIRVSDLFGNESFSSYSVKVNALCDYNGDGKIDAFDLGRYVKSWSELDYSGSDIYPYDGSLPYVIVLGDGKLDVYDVFTFTKIWDYSHTQGLPKVLSFDGFDFAYLTSGGEFVFKPDISGDFVSYGFEIIHRGVKVDSFNVLRDGISLVFMDSLRDVIYFDYSKFGGIKEDGLELFRIKFGGFGSGDSVVVKFYVYDGNSLSLGKEVLKKVYVLKFDDMPKEFRLYQNYPNPFNPSTFIKFDLPREAKVKLGVYDVMGRLVRVLVDEQMQAGRYRVEFRGDGLASGVYFYRLEAGGFVSVKKMVLVK